MKYSSVISRNVIKTFCSSLWNPYSLNVVKFLLIMLDKFIRLWNCNKTNNACQCIGHLMTELLNKTSPKRWQHNDMQGFLNLAKINYIDRDICSTENVFQFNNQSSSPQQLISTKELNNYPWEQTPMKFESKFYISIEKKIKIPSPKWWTFCFCLSVLLTLLLRTWSWAYSLQMYFYLPLLFNLFKRRSYLLQPSVTMTSYGRHGLSNHRPLECF